MLQHHNAITIQNRINAVRNRDNGALAEQRRAQRRLQQGVGLDVYGCCGLVQDEDVGRCEQGAR